MRCGQSWIRPSASSRLHNVFVTLSPIRAARSASVERARIGRPVFGSTAERSLVTCQPAPSRSAFAGVRDDGTIRLTNNAAERSLRGIALGRKAWLFTGSDRGGDRAAFMYALIVTAKLDDVDPEAWLAEVPARIASTPMHRLGELLSRNRVTEPRTVKAA